MKCKRWITWVLLLSFPLSALGFSVHVFFAGRVVGHEEITRQAILLTKHIFMKVGVDLSDDLLEQMTRIQKLPGNLEATDIDIIERVGLIPADNPLVFGNYAADKPDDERWIPGYQTDIYGRNHFPKGYNMLKWGGARSFHFTLNEYISQEDFDTKTATPTYVGETPTKDVFYQSGREACYDAKAYIVDYSLWGLQALAERARIKLEKPERSWKNGYGLSREFREKMAEYEAVEEQRKRLLRAALFRFGVATHVIQDSFSPSHTFRAPYGGAIPLTNIPEYKNYDVIEVCYYDQVIPHAFTTAEEWAHNLILQDTNDDDLPDEEKVVQPPELRLAHSRSKSSPCAHGKFDKNDNIWISTAVQMEILEAQNWDKWEKEIWTYIARGWSWDVREAAADLQRYCNRNRYKTSEFSAFKCLKHEARLARTATVKYFLVLMSHVRAFQAEGKEVQLDGAESQERLTQALETQFFEGTPVYRNAKGEIEDYTTFGLNEIMPLGVMRCDQIRTPQYRKTNEQFSRLN